MPNILNSSNNQPNTGIAQKGTRQYLGTIAVTSAGAWQSLPGWNPETNYAQLVPDSGGTVRFTDLITSATLVSTSTVEVFGSQFFAKTQAAASSDFFLVMYKEQ